MSDILMCPVCNKIYYRDAINPKLPICPDIKCDCDIKLFEIDELMIEPITILNQKNYYTEYCCSGHIYNSDKFIAGYIMFYDDLLDDASTDTFPDGWYREGNCIRYKIENRDKYNCLELRKMIDNKIESLLEWAINLPENEW